MAGFIRNKNKWDHKNAPSNRDLMRHNDVLSAILDAFNWLDSRERQRERKREKNEEVVRSPRRVFSTSSIKPSQEPVARHNIINAISDPIPPSKLTEQTRPLFKGKSFEYMAINYPFILITFLKERKELCFPKEVFDQLIYIAKCQIDSRS